MNIDTSKIANTLRKLKHKNPALFKAVQKKICQIASLDEISINHFKIGERNGRVKIKDT